MAEPRRVAFFGIGHPLRRDDAAGLEVCERLRPALHGRSDVLVVAGGSAPENCVGALRAFDPDEVIILDAACMGEPPGTLLRIDPSDPRAAAASTHTLPLPTFCAYLHQTLGCDVTLLGIEPADTSFGEGLTPAVELAVKRAAREALDRLGRRTSTSPPYPLSAKKGLSVDGSWREGEGEGVRGSRFENADVGDPLTVFAKEYSP
jgi:hydrogenase 3 maturation protease